MKHVVLLAVLGTLLWASPTSAGKREDNEDDLPVMHMALLQFTLNGDNPYEFAAYAVEFGDSIKEILSKDSEFDNVNAVVLGVGKTDCGILVIAVVEYTLNETASAYEDNESLLQHIVDLIEQNMDLFEQIYGMKSVRSVDADQTNIKFVSHKNAIASVKTIAGSVVGALALIGVAALVVGLVAVYTFRGKTYEKVPLLADEGTAKKWMPKLPWSKKPKNEESPEF